MEVYKRRDFLLRVADHLGLGVFESYNERLCELVRFFSNHPPEKWCVCEHVAYEVTEKDHKSNCPRRKELKRQRLELERVEREVLEEVERVEREEVERKRHEAYIARVAADIERLFSGEVAESMSDTTLAKIVAVAAAEQRRRGSTITTA